MGCCPSQNTQNQCQGDAIVPGEGGTGPPCSTQCTSSQNMLLPLPFLAISLLKKKKMI